MDERLPDALEIVVARTKHERFRELLDPAHADFNPAYEAVVLRLAGYPVPAHEPVETDAERRARKPRMALGARQNPDPDCIPCQEKATLTPGDS